MIHPGCSGPVCFRLCHLLRQSQYAIARLFWFAAILSGLYRANHMEMWLYHFPARGRLFNFRITVTQRSSGVRRSGRGNDGGKLRAPEPLLCPAVDGRFEMAVGKMCGRQRCG